MFIKFTFLLALLVATVSAEAPLKSGPYPAAGWRPQKPFFLPNQQFPDATFEQQYNNQAANPQAVDFEISKEPVVFAGQAQDSSLLTASQPQNAYLPPNDVGNQDQDGNDDDSLQVQKLPGFERPQFLTEQQGEAVQSFQTQPQGQQNFRPQLQAQQSNFKTQQQPQQNSGPQQQRFRPQLQAQQQNFKTQQQNFKPQPQLQQQGFRPQPQAQQHSFNSQLQPQQQSFRPQLQAQQQNFRPQPQQQNFRPQPQQQNFRPQTQQQNFRPQLHVQQQNFESQTQQQNFRPQSQQDFNTQEQQQFFSPASAKPAQQYGAPGQVNVVYLEPRSLEPAEEHNYNAIEEINAALDAVYKRRAAAKKAAESSPVDGVEEEEPEANGNDYSSADPLNSAPSRSQMGQYYILGPDNELQRVMFTTSQDEQEAKSKGFTAQLKYTSAGEIRDPIFRYNERGQLIRILRK